MADSEGVTLVAVTKVESTEQSTVQIVVNGDDADASGDVVLAVSEEEKTPTVETAEATPPAEVEPAAAAPVEETKAEESMVEVEPETPGVKETHEFSAPECQAESVVVYLDRAEVCRSLKASLERGEHEIIIKDMSAYIDEESIRVEGIGAATISEVSFQKKFTPDHLVDPSKKQEKTEQLRQELKEAAIEMKVLKAKHARLDKQRVVLDGLADKLVTVPASGGENNAASNLLSTDAVRNMVSFVEMYDEQTARLDDSLHDLEQETRRLEETMNAIRKNLGEVNSSSATNEARVLCILLDVAKDADVQLKVSYVVSNAMWSPKYDLRVFSKDGKMKISYYGIVQQSTGEDWTDTRLILSTAMPSVGGNIPVLDGWKLGFKPKQPKKVGKSMSFLRGAPARVEKMGRNIMAKSATLPPAGPPEPQMMMASSMAEDEEVDELCVAFQAQVKENVTSTMYEIPRIATIPCDNIGHKVSVAIIDLEPTFQHECVPKKSSHAFLRAHVKNTSPYALLAGPSNVFLDNNFIAKADLKAVSPSEEFDCSLGVDPAVKVDYKPMHKFREQTGFMSKHVTFTYRQEIAIKNTRQDDVAIHVIDKLPQSTEEKIRVKLLEPEIKPTDKHSAAKPVRLNSQNNIEWDLTVGQGKTTELVLKYTVEHPSGEEIVELM